VLTNPGNKTGTVGVATSLQLAATDPNNDELGYGASGLPTGLTLNAHDRRDQRHADRGRQLQRRRRRERRREYGHSVVPVDDSDPLRCRCSRRRRRRRC
jgi:hypothetical protein